MQQLHSLSAQKLHRNNLQEISGYMTKLILLRYNQLLTDINWNEKLCNFDDVDDMWEEFSKMFLQISSACIPSKTILIREKDKPWFSNEIRKEIRIRDRLRKKILKSQNENNIIKYKKQRNKVNNMKKIAK